MIPNRIDLGARRVARWAVRFNIAAFGCASFTNDLGADSLDTVELIMEFEKEFNISIPDEQAETITTVGQAVAYLEEHAK